MISKKILLLMATACLLMLGTSYKKNTQTVCQSGAWKKSFQIQRGMTRADVEHLLGTPTTAETWASRATELVFEESKNLIGRPTIPGMKVRVPLNERSAEYIEGKESVSIIYLSGEVLFVGRSAATGILKDALITDDKTKEAITKMVASAPSIE